MNPKTFPAIVLILLIIISSEMMGQSLSLNAGWYGNIHRGEAPGDDLASRSTLHHKLFGSIELYFSELLDSDRFYRIGIRVQGTQIIAKPLNPSNENLANREGIDYKMGSLLLNYQRKLVYKEPVYVLLNLSSGFTFFSSELRSGFNYSDTFLGNLPDTKFTLNGGFDYIVKLEEKIAVRLGARYTYFTGKNEEIYPFSPGPSIEIGLLFGNN